MYRIVAEICSVWFHLASRFFLNRYFLKHDQTHVLAVWATSQASKPRHVVVETIVLLRRDWIKLIDPYERSDGSDASEQRKRKGILRPHSYHEGNLISHQCVPLALTDLYIYIYGICVYIYMVIHKLTNLAVNLYGF